MMAFIKSGHVSGVDSWDHEERGHSPLLALYWSKLQADATYSVAKEYKWGGVVGTIAELVNDIIDVTAGAVGAALGVVIGATREAIDWLGATLGRAAHSVWSGESSCSRWRPWRVRALGLR